MSNMLSTLNQLYHRLASPRHFYHLTGMWLPWLWILAVAALLIGWGWGLFWVPPDYQMGNSFRIIYVHVPAAVFGLLIYVFIAGASGVYLVWRIKMAYRVAMAALLIGAAYTAISLFTGAVWGKPTWGTYWVWDARLTSMLMLFFLYLGLALLANAYADNDKGSRAVALLAVVGVLMVPLIKFSVEWWNTLHQPASGLFAGSAIHISMRPPLWFALAGYGLLAAAVTITEARRTILVTEWRQAWVREMLVGKSGVATNAGDKA